MSTPRPVFQAVLKYRYPVTAIASVLHRISGVILFLLIPLLLWLLYKSLLSSADFQLLQNKLNHPVAITILWVMLAALIYHLVAGIRHILMDLGFAESLKGGRRGAYTVFIITIVLLLIIGVWV